MITLDLNHFGFQRAGRPERRKERRRRRKRREEESQTRANLNGGELDGEKQSQASINGAELDFGNTESTHKGNHRRRGAPSQGQPKWWRAGLGAVPPR